MKHKFTYQLFAGLLLSLSLLAPMSAVADVKIDATNFPDKNFRNYLLAQSYGKDGVITDDEIAGISVISVQGNGTISSLEGIQYFTALTYLSCNGNLLTSLDVSGCTALTELQCHTNQLTSLNVSGCTALTRLSCQNNQLTSLDVSGCTALEWLQCYENQLTSLDVSGCTALATLQCKSNLLTSLNCSGCTALVNLNCVDNYLTSLNCSECVALKSLSCTNNNLNGLNMSRFIESLPKVSTCSLSVRFSEYKSWPAAQNYKPENNVITKSQVAALKAKGFTTTAVWVMGAGAYTQAGAYGGVDDQNLSASAKTDILPFLEDKEGYFTLTKEAKEKIGWQESYNESCPENDYYLMQIRLEQLLKDPNSLILPESGYYRLKSYTGNQWVRNTSGTAQAKYSDSNDESACTIVKVEQDAENPMLYALQMQGEYIDGSTGSDEVAWYSVEINPSEPAMLGWAMFKKDNHYLQNSDTGKVGYADTAADDAYWTMADAEEIPIPVRAGQGEYWGTIYAPFGLTLPEGTEAYAIVKNNVSKALTLNPIGQYVPAGMPVLIKGSNASVTAEIGDDGSAVVVENDLTGQYLAYNEPTKEVWSLGMLDGVVGFYVYTGTIGANKAVINASGASGANGFRIALGDDDVTGIGSASAEAAAIDAACYDLQGRRVAKPHKGQIYIVNGKAVVY